MKRSIQGSSKARPAPEDRDLALVLHCVTCGTLRSFAVEANLSAVQARLVGAIGVESTCSICGRSVGASIAWTNNNRRGYPFHAPPPMEGLRVEDGVGLEKPGQQ